MKAEIADRWATALEGNEYRQTIDVLSGLDEEGARCHCAFGVLCELAVQDGVTTFSMEDNGSGVYGRQPVDGGYSIGRVFSPPDEVVEWAGVTQEEAEYVINLNDRRKLSFPEIAARIRELRSID